MSSRASAAEDGVHAIGPAQTNSTAEHQLAALLAENAHLRSELRLRDCALNSTSTGVLIIDMLCPGRPIVYANRAVTERSGYPLQELLGQPSTLLTPRDKNGDRVLQVRDAMRGGKELRIELISARKDGSNYWSGMNLTPIFDEARKITHYVCISADITARRASEQQSRRDRERLTAVVESALEGVIALSNSFHITLFNQAAEKMFLRKSVDVIGKSVDILVPTRYRDQHQEHMRRFVESGAQRRVMGAPGPLTGLRADGEEFPFEASISRVSIGEDIVLTVMLRDVSEQLKAEKEKLQLEAQLRLAQKLEAVGSLAAGVAHEMNTPIQYVGNSVHFLQGASNDVGKLVDLYRECFAKLEAGESIAAVKELLAEAEQAADIDFLRDEVPKAFDRTLDGVDRVTQIVRAMKEFSHPDGDEQNPAEINHALQTTLIVARNEYKYVAEVETHFGELPPVVCNIGELNQVFLNMIVNAAHAIGDTGKDSSSGRISITTEEEGAHVKIIFEDNGCGIPQKNLDKIFDPFFTTKEVGRGTGQGLAITRSIIVDKHAGSIHVDSTVGSGTKFTLRLPVAGRPRTEGT